MASGRILKTQISFSEQVNDLSIHAALLFTWMIPHADDFGRMHGSARKIKAIVVPMRDDFTKDVVEACLVEISNSQLIERYSVNSEIFIQFPGWEEHQSGLHKRTKSKLPPPPENNNFPEIPGNSEIFPLELELEQEQEQEQEQELKPEKISGSKKLKNPIFEIDLLKQHGVEGQLAKDFLATRKNKLTKTAMDGIVREANNAGISVFDAITICAERSWQSFNACWEWPGKNKTNGCHGPPLLKNVMPKVDYGEYEPSKDRFNALRVIDGEVIRDD